MMKCSRCGDENPESQIFCNNCGSRLYAVEPDADDNEARLSNRIKELEDVVTSKDQELQDLQKRIEEVSKNHPEVQSLRQELLSLRQHLDDKETRLQEHLRELQQLRGTAPQPKSEPGSQVVIDSYPVKKDPFRLVMDEGKDSIDLATTDYRIRATLERTADGFQVVVHSGADLNLRSSEKEFRWTRLKEGARASVNAGTILFDTKGAMNARLSLQNES